MMQWTWVKQDESDDKLQWNLINLNFVILLNVVFSILTQSAVTLKGKYPILQKTYLFLSFKYCVSKTEPRLPRFYCIHYKHVINDINIWLQWIHIHLCIKCQDFQYKNMFVDLAIHCIWNHYSLTFDFFVHSTHDILR